MYRSVKKDIYNLNEEDLLYAYESCILDVYFNGEYNFKEKWKRILYIHMPKTLIENNRYIVKPYKEAREIIIKRVKEEYPEQLEVR